LPSATVVAREKLLSPLFARPEPPSDAVHAIETLFACHAPSAVPQLIVGPAVSRTMASVAVAETFPAASRNCAHTVFEPSPLVRAWEIVVLKLVADVTETKEAPEQSEPLATRYAVTPTASVALSASEAVVLFVNDAPPLMTTDGLAGGAVSLGAAA
jgi:hypothetical protein